MKQKKKIKISIIFMITVIIALIILIIGSGAYFIISKKLTKENNIAVDCRKIEYSLGNLGWRRDNKGVGFLNTNYNYRTKYQLINTYEQFDEIKNTIDSWLKDTVMEFGISKTRESDEDEYTLLEKETEKIKEEFQKKTYNESYFEKYDLLLVENLTYGSVVHEIKLKNVNVKDNIMNVNIKKESGGSVGGGKGALFFITVNKEKTKNVKKINVNINNTNTSVPGVSYKPIIYLYPTTDTQINVILKNSQNLTCSYPKYTNGWNVTASPDGNLVDTSTNRNLYSLYYESENSIDFTIENDGFVIKSEDTASFLEEKLAILGLNEREAEEFIIYWLPILEKNKYNYIRFATAEEINQNMPLEITPRPNTMIRILMTYKGLDNPIKVEEQKLIPQQRNGFVSVEWGGTEIK